MRVNALTAERLRELLVYDPETGVFTWRVARRGRRGDRAGSPGPKGYRQICVDGINYREHRLVWLYVTGEWPPPMLDHKDGDRANNRFTNLRPCTASQNNASRHRSRNTNGWKGIQFYRGKWSAHIKGANPRNLGRYDCPAAAHLAYVIAAAKEFGEFARAA